MKFLICAFAVLLFPMYIKAQSCCSGGSGSPIAGGTSQGVLYKKQAEVSTNIQYINSGIFLTGDKRAKDFLDNYNSTYLYNRVAYGITEKLTLSLESGYFFNKTQIGLNNRDTISSSGFGDFIIFPRYSIYAHNTEKTRNEITLGFGLKIPVGKYLDSSVIYTDQSGINYYTPKPPAVMPTTGSNDFIFYAFGYRGYPETQFRMFTSLLYVRKGWNPLGQKFGDYASASVFAGQTFLKHFGATLELKGEWIDKMDYNKNIDMLALYNLDVESTGGKRVLLVPQLSYKYKDFSTFISSEIPLYQYINGTAIGSEYQFTLGMAYRFYPHKI